ncbi:hypothetical protein DM02DRAFT_726667 [Periconia macrospinosa]|uniref:Uncharacterized protein n=1 Tax=Periconia macrospinosa TaxID=97972 RepID=A0A2V1DXU9_9PLEO|nr:hypothetical protein DM02DRAFT_726667 [Periconia macrospinosa]
MCTHYSLHYACKHIKSVHRCPRTGVRVSNVPPIVQREPKPGAEGCGKEYFMEGRLDDDCIDCKVSRGVIPGTEGSGMKSWIDWRGDKVTHALAGMNDRAQRMEKMRELGTMDPRLLNASNRRMYHGTEETQEKKKQAQELENVDPFLPTGYKPAVWYSKNPNDMVFIAEKGTGARNDRKSPQAQQVNTNIDSGRLPSYTNTSQAAGVQFEGRVHQATAVENEHSNRMKMIFEQLNAYDRFQSPSYPRPNSFQEKLGENRDNTQDGGESCPNTNTDTPLYPASREGQQRPPKDTPPSSRKRSIQHENPSETTSTFKIKKLKWVDFDAPKYADSPVQAELKGKAGRQRVA